MYAPFTAVINCSKDLIFFQILGHQPRISKVFLKTIEHFFSLSVVQTILGTKYHSLKVIGLWKTIQQTLNRLEISNKCIWMHFPVGIIFHVKWPHKCLDIKYPFHSMKQLFSGCEKKPYNLLYHKKDIVQVISDDVYALFLQLN